MGSSKFRSLSSLLNRQKRSLGVNGTKQLLEVEGLRREEGCLIGGRRKWSPHDE